MEQVLGYQNLALTMLGLRCLLDIHVETLTRNLDIQVWNSGVSSMLVLPEYGLHLKPWNWMGSPRSKDR